MWSRLWPKASWEHEQWVWNKNNWVKVLVMWPAGKLFHFSERRFLHLESGDNSPYIIRLLWGLIKIIFVKCLENSCISLLSPGYTVCYIANTLSQISVAYNKDLFLVYLTCWPQPCSMCPLHSGIWASIWHRLFSWQKLKNNGGTKQLLLKLLLVKHSFPFIF